jgi:hypothetical protein
MLAFNLSRSLVNMDILVDSVKSLTGMEV